jgi:hypothetical protein
MPTVQELTDRYNGYSDEELYATHARMHEYTPEAREALEFVLSQKGGREALLKRINSKAESMHEIQRLTGQARTLLLAGLPPARVKDQLQSPRLAPDEIAGIVDDSVAQRERETSDRKIKPRTLIGSLFGGLLGGTVGGIVLGISMIQSHRLFVVFIAGAALLCYGFIRWFTRQTGNNSMVVAATVLASLYAFGLAWVLFMISA